MREAYKPLRLLVAVLLGLLGVVIVSRWMAPHEIIPWQSDLPTAQQESKTSNKPILLYLTAEWCGPCQSLKSTTWTDPAVESALRSYVPVKIDIDQHPDLARQYGSEAIPRFVVIDPNGNVTKSTEGALPPSEFIAWLKT